MTDHYDTLGVPKDASADDIKKAYRKKASKAHPDRHDDKEAAGREMAKINQAYDCLGDQARRARYDQTGSDDTTDPRDYAVKMVMTIFMQLLREDADRNIPGLARSRLRDRQEEMRSNVTRMEAQRDKLVKKRDRVKTKGGARNLFQQLIDSELAMAAHAIATQKTEIERIGTALQLLEDYEANDPPEAAASNHPRHPRHTDMDEELMRMIQGSFGRGPFRRF